MQNSRNIFLVIILAIAVSGCTSVRQLDIFKTEVERAPLDLPNPEIPKLEDIKWVIITSENADEVFAKLKEQGKDPVLFGLSDDDYQLLSKNFAQIRAFMIKQGMTLEQYRKYYESDDNTSSTDPK